MSALTVKIHMSAFVEKNSMLLFVKNMVFVQKEITILGKD